MTRHGRPQVAVWIRPDRVAGTLPDRRAAVDAQVRFEIAALQAARLMVRASARPAADWGSRPSSRYDATISAAASSNIARASSTVGAQVTTAGHSASWRHCPSVLVGSKDGCERHGRLHTRHYGPSRRRSAPVSRSTVLAVSSAPALMKAFVPQRPTPEDRLRPRPGNGTMGCVPRFPSIGRRKSTSRAASAALNDFYGLLGVRADDGVRHGRAREQLPERNVVVTSELE